MFLMSEGLPATCLKTLSNSCKHLASIARVKVGWGHNPCPSLWRCVMQVLAHRRPRSAWEKKSKKANSRQGAHTSSLRGCATWHLHQPRWHRPPRHLYTCISCLYARGPLPLFPPLAPQQARQLGGPKWAGRQARPYPAAMHSSGPLGQRITAAAAASARLDYGPGRVEERVRANNRRIHQP